jgi:hypothetical protein
LNTEGAEDRPSVRPPSQAVQSLLRDVAALCALGGVTEESAVAIFRYGYRNARVGVPGDCDARGDAFTAGEVLSEWHENPHFLTSEGMPAPLSIAAGAFSRLCTAASAESDQDELLDVLTRAGAVRRDGDTVIATRRELILSDNHPAGVNRAIRMSSEYTSTLNHNLSRAMDDPGRFERNVASSKLSPRHVPALLGYLKVHGQSFLEDLDSWIAARESGSAGCTIGVGVYLFIDSGNR